MKCLFIFTLAFVLLTCVCKKPAYQDQELGTKQIIVKFKTDASQSQIDSLTKELGFEKVKEIPELNIKVYKLVPGMSMDEAIRKCQKNSCVEYAEPDYEVRALDGK